MAQGISAFWDTVDPDMILRQQVDGPDFDLDEAIESRIAELDVPAACAPDEATRSARTWRVVDDLRKGVDEAVRVARST